MTKNHAEALVIKHMSISDLKAYPGNARTHSTKQINSLAKAIGEFGFNNPVLINQDNQIIAGHARLEAAKTLNLNKIPIIRLEHLTPAQVRAYRIADNRLAELAEWDEDTLRLELMELSLPDLNLDLTMTGFEMAEIDLLIKSAPEEPPEDEAEVPSPSEQVVSRLGDLWLLGQHKIVCADSTLATSYTSLLGDERAELIFTDPPYNVPIKGHVLSGSGCNHKEFIMASGEMTEAEFMQFLHKTITCLIEYSIDGSLHFICMDWRHLWELLNIGKKKYDELKNICIWNKTNGGMGSLYRSKHEMICLFKNGRAPHTNNIELGRYGRYRTNVWDYAGQSTLHADREDELAMHPTVKPVQLVEDAIYDCSHRNGIVLDSFGGSGTTLIACQRAGRQARLIEIAPEYVDVTIRRWQRETGLEAILSQTNQTFSDVEALRVVSDE